MNVVYVCSGTCVFCVYAWDEGKEKKKARAHKAENYSVTLIIAKRNLVGQYANKNEKRI